MHQASFDEGIDLILSRDSRYHRDAYVFLREALDHTQKMILKEHRGKLRHVSGQELLAGIRDYALDQFGPMTITVFEEWGIHTCEDFGRMVFNMVEIGLLAKTDQDSPEDFQNGYDFDTAFRQPFLPHGKSAKTTKPVA